MSRRRAQAATMQPSDTTTLDDPVLCDSDALAAPARGEVGDCDGSAPRRVSDDTLENSSLQNRRTAHTAATGGAQWCDLDASQDGTPSPRSGGSITVATVGSEEPGFAASDGMSTGDISGKVPDASFGDGGSCHVHASAQPAEGRPQVNSSRDAEECVIAAPNCTSGRSGLRDIGDVPMLPATRDTLGGRSCEGSVCADDFLSSFGWVTTPPELSPSCDPELDEDLCLSRNVCVTQEDAAEWGGTLLLRGAVQSSHILHLEMLAQSQPRCEGESRTSSQQSDKPEPVPQLRSPCVSKTCTLMNPAAEEHVSVSVSPAEVNIAVELAKKNELAGQSAAETPVEQCAAARPTAASTRSSRSRTTTTERCAAEQVKHLAQESAVGGGQKGKARSKSATTRGQEEKCAPHSMRKLETSTPRVADLEDPGPAVEPRRTMAGLPKNAQSGRGHLRAVGAQRRSKSESAKGPACAHGARNAVPCGALPTVTAQVERSRTSRSADDSHHKHQEVAACLPLASVLTTPHKAQAEPFNVQRHPPDPAPNRRRQCVSELLEEQKGSRAPLLNHLPKLPGAGHGRSLSRPTVKKVPSRALSLPRVRV